MNNFLDNVTIDEIEKKYNEIKSKDPRPITIWYAINEDDDRDYEYNHYEEGWEFEKDIPSSLLDNVSQKQWKNKSWVKELAYMTNENKVESIY